MTKQKIAAYIVIGTLALTGKNPVAEATEIPKASILPELSVVTEVSEVPVAGISVLLDALYQTSLDGDRLIEQYLAEETNSEKNSLAFAKVTNYVNIRSEAKEDSEILGKLYNNSSATITDKVGDWYLVKSGKVIGYIRSDFLVTGEKASELGKTLGVRQATVTTTTLKVRAKASTEAEILTLIPIDDQYEVVREMDGWAEILIEEGASGYVSTDYVQLDTIYEEAVSIEEEQERLAEEEASREQERIQEARDREEQISSYSVSSSNSSSSRKSTSTSSTKKSSSSNQSSSNTEKTNNSSSEDDTSDTNSTNEDNDTTNNSSLGSRIASYAIQFQGNPYEWGGTSLTNGADCSGFTQSVFAHFGISISRTSRSQASSGKKVSLSNLRQGDLVFYTKNGRINHVALYIGNGKVISASSPSTGIRISKYNYRTPYKAVRYIN